MSKTIKTRVIQKHAIEENWKKATNFIPLIGEIIVYDPDETHQYSRFKIGDGEKTVNELSFSNDGIEVATSDDALDLLYSMNYVSPTMSSTNAIYTDNNDKLYTL